MTRHLHGLCSGLAVATLVLATASNAHAQEPAQGKLDVTGTWVFDVITDTGAGTATLTLKQEGETLSGHFSSATLGEADVNGSVKGRDIAFGFTATVRGTAIEVTYSGTIEGNDSMKGSINLGGVAGGTFTGKRT
jgi:hypothetical protein